MRIEFGFDRLPIEMPCGMAKQGDDDGKAKIGRASCRERVFRVV